MTRSGRKETKKLREHVYGLVEQKRLVLWSCNTLLVAWYILVNIVRALGYSLPLSGITGDLVLAYELKLSNP